MLPVAQQRRYLGADDITSHRIAPRAFFTCSQLASTESIKPGTFAGMLVLARSAGCKGLGSTARQARSGTLACTPTLSGGGAAAADRAREAIAFSGRLLRSTLSTADVGRIAARTGSKPCVGTPPVPRSSGDALSIDPDVRKPLLYPAELRDQKENFRSRYFLGIYRFSFAEHSYRMGCG